MPRLGVVIVESHKDFSFPFHYRASLPSHEPSSSNMASRNTQAHLMENNRFLLDVIIWRDNERDTLRWILERRPEDLTRCQIYQAFVQLGVPNSDHHRPHCWSVTHFGKRLLIYSFIHRTDSTFHSTRPNPRRHSANM